LLVVATGCGSGSGQSAAPKCGKAPAGIGPDANATLQDADSGRTVCLKPGEVLTVFLHAPVGEDRWSSVTTRARDVLAPRSTGVLTLPLGVTGAVYQAQNTGTAQLASMRPPCTSPGSTGCDPSHVWTARIVVR